MPLNFKSIHESLVDGNVLEAKFQQALIFHKQGQFAQALALYEEILKSAPKHVDSLHLLGVIACQTQNFRQSVELINRAIEILPNNAAFYSNRGNALQELNQLDDAVESYDCAILLNPDYAEAYSNRGNVLQKLKRLEDAVESHDRALALNPYFADAYFNRGNVFQELNQFDYAIKSYNQAIVLNPEFIDAYYSRGNALKELNHLAAAVESYNQAIALKPDYADAQLNKALALLMDREFDNGWKLYEWRWSNEKAKLRKRNFTQSLWLGKESLKGKTIFLHSEQGFGDTIQFCRYTKLVAELGARIIIEVEKPLVGLLQDLAGVADLLEKGSILPPFDYHCPLMSLPLAFNTNIDSIPYSGKYLRSNKSKLTYWASKLGEKQTLRVGLVWSGNAEYKNDKHRSILLADLIKHLPLHCQYVSLQKEVREIDKSALNSNANILHFGDELNDFADTAALCECMDIVISVDTSVAHVSGAIGKETWLLLPFCPDWRWMLDRDDSPWYPSVKLYRQSNIGDWGSAFLKVNADLAGLINNKTAF